MAEKDMFIMSQRDLRRLHIIRQVIEKQLSRQEAARILDLCKKQIGRIVKRVKEEGDGGICHRSRGRASTRSKPQAMKERALLLYQEKYSGDGPTFASEKLADRHRIPISDETLRLWLIAASIPYPRRRKRPHRQWRERKHYRGEMVQMDGSHHDWFEGRRAPCVLMGYVDDATGTVYARFYEYEGTLPALDSFQRYIRQYGIPQSLYLDKHSTYKSQAKPTIAEELSGAKQQSQFERACSELGVTVIHAHSPQAKGRIERLFRTLQDRLVKELRIRDISGIPEANRFLDDEFLEEMNLRFTKPSAERQNLHIRASTRQLERVLCIKTEHVVRNDHTIMHERKLYQIEEPTTARKVVVEDRPDGARFITYKKRKLAFREISQRPAKETAPAPMKHRLRHQWTPPANHPWKRPYKPIPKQPKRVAQSP
jgi:transposase